MRNLYPLKTKLRSNLKGSRKKISKVFSVRRTLRFFYHLDVIKDTITTSTSVVVAVSANQEAIQVPEGMLIEKRVPDLLSLLESHANEATPKISVVPRPSTPTSAPSPKIDPFDNKRKKG